MVGQTSELLRIHPELPRHLDLPMREAKFPPRIDPDLIFRR